MAEKTTIETGLSIPTRYEFGTSRRAALARRVERPLEVAVVLAAIATIPLVIALEQGVSDPLLLAADWLVWGVFAVDFLAHGILATSRRHYFLHSWLSLAIVVLSFPLLPYFMDLIRLTRLLRLLRLTAVLLRGIEALLPALGRPGLIYVASLTGILMLAGGAVLTLLEPDTVKGDFWNGVWWAVVTATTVGYGDIAPVTMGGRILGGLLMFTGIGLVATLAASIAAHFVAEDDRKKEAADIRALERRLDRIEALLRESRPADGDDRKA